MRHNLQSLFGLDLSTAQKVIVASVVILILLVLLGLFVRQIQGGGLKLKGQSGGRARQPRLGVVDAHNLDRQRQLILIRRDNVEHLVMIGGASDVVIETNIMRSGARAAPQPLDFAMTERPPAFENFASPEAGRQEPVRQEPTAVAQQRPDMLPPLPPRQVPPASPPRPVQTQTQADAALVTTTAVAVPAALAAAANAVSLGAPAGLPTPNVTPPNFARDHASSPAASAVELDSMARQLEEALKRPFSAVRPANSPGEPRESAKPAGVSEEAPVEARPDEIVEAPVVPLPAPPPPAAPKATGQPVALAVDVEAELELALGLKPARAASPPPYLGESHAPIGNEPKPPADAAVYDEATSADDDDLTIVPSEAPAPPDAPIGGPENQAGTVEPELTGSELSPAKEPAPEPEQKPAAIDPFSVDAIEAEFARLLGRDPKTKS